MPKAISTRSVQKYIAADLVYKSSLCDSQRRLAVGPVKKTGIAVVYPIIALY